MKSGPMFFFLIRVVFQRCPGPHLSRFQKQRFLADVRRPKGRCGEADFIPTPNVANTGTNGDWPGFTKETALTK
jgi:hypothetical protein